MSNQAWAAIHTAQAGAQAWFDKWFKNHWLRIKNLSK